MKKKNILIIIAIIVVILTILVSLYFFFFDKPVDLTEKYEVQPVNEEEFKSSAIAQIECTKDGEFEEIVIGDLDVEDDDIEGEAPENADELVTDFEYEDDDEEESTPKKYNYEINTNSANIGKVKRNIKLIISYYRNYINVTGEIQLTFDNKEGYNKYYIAKYGENDKVTTNEEALTKNIKYSIDTESNEASLSETSAKKTMEAYESQGYTCKQIKDE